MKVKEMVERTAVLIDNAVLTGQYEPIHKLLSVACEDQMIREILINHTIDNYGMKQYKLLFET